MIYERLVLGTMETNGYVLRADASARRCVVIDSGLDNTELVDCLQSNDLTPEAMILTHGHGDHIQGVNDLREHWPDVKVAVHAADADMLTDSRKNLSWLANLTIVTEPADILIEEEGPVEFAGVTLQVLHTPGHSAGGISLYHPKAKAVFVGDAVFAGAIGRTDFPGGSYSELVDNIKRKILTLPDDTDICPGHGPTTTVAHEKIYNQYLRD